MEEALKWWNALPDELKSEFPEPESNEDVLKYYTDPSDYIYSLRHSIYEQ